MSTKILLSLLALCFTLSYVSAQDEEMLFFDATKDNISSFKWAMPELQGFHSKVKKKKRNSNFIHSIESHVFFNLNYPLEAYFSKKNGNVIADILYDDLGEIHTIEIFSFTDSVFCEAALKSISNLPSGEPARMKNKKMAFKLRLKIDFNLIEYDQKKDAQYNLFNCYYQDIFARDSTFLYPPCDTCKTNYSSAKHIEIWILENMKFSEKLPKTGHVFTKFQIDENKNILPFPYVFENTTKLNDTEINESLSAMSLPSSVDFTNYSHSSETEFELLIFFNEDGIQTMRKDENGVQRMPVFLPGCANIEDPIDQAKCSEVNIINYVISNVNYPEIAIERRYTDRVFVEFVVGKSGYITDVKVLKGNYAVLNFEAAYAVKSLARFQPAMQRGVPVKVKYTIPVNFKLSW